MPPYVWDDDPPEPSVCPAPGCGRRFTWLELGRPATYCSSACRKRAWRARRRDEVHTHPIAPDHPGHDDSAAHSVQQARQEAR